MKRPLAVLLALAFAALGSGGLGYLHQLQHDWEDAAADHGSSQPRPVHDDCNCAFHARLHSPLAASLAAAVLVLTVALLAFVVLPARLIRPRFLALTIDCRGPPSC